MKDSEYQRHKRTSRAQAMDRVIALILEGHSTASALRDVGRTRNTFDRHWMLDQDWRRRYYAAKAAAGTTVGSAGDFINFRELYFRRATPGHHLQIIQAIENTKADEWTLVLAPPEAAKTSILVDYVCHKLGPVDPNFRIAVIAESQILGKDILWQVSQRMTDKEQFPAYIDAYGPFKYEPKNRKEGDRDTRKPWNTEFLTVLKAQHDEKDPSLIAKGVGSQIYGARYDLVVVDDIQSLNNLSATRDLLRYLQQHVATRLAKDKGRMVILGSRVGPGDIYEALLDAGLIDNFVSIPALSWPCRLEDMEPGTIVDGHPIESYWPDYWDLPALAQKRRKVGEETWQRSYMQRPGATSRMTFREETIQLCLDKERQYPDKPEGQQILGVDPAIGGWVGLIGVRLTYDKLYVTDLDNINGFDRTEQLLDLVRAHAAQWRPQTVIVEKDGWGKGIGNDDRMVAISNLFSFDVLPHVTRNMKADGALGVASMASSFSLGEISIPWGDEETQQRFRPLVNELRNYRLDEKGRPLNGRVLRQDLVMALWFCWKYWREVRDAMDAEPQHEWRPSWMTDDDTTWAMAFS